MNALYQLAIDWALAHNGEAGAASCGHPINACLCDDCLCQWCERELLELGGTKASLIPLDEC